MTILSAKGDAHFDLREFMRNREVSNLCCNMKGIFIIIKNASKIKLCSLGIWWLIKSTYRCSFMVCPWGPGFMAMFLHIVHTHTVTSWVNAHIYVCAQHTHIYTRHTHNSFLLVLVWTTVKKRKTINQFKTKQNKRINSKQIPCPSHTNISLELL